MPDDLAELLATVEPVALGARLKQARLLAGLTQTQLADGAASVGYVSRIESGQRRPDLSVLLRLAERLNASPLALLTGAPDPTLTRMQVALDHAELTLRGGSPDAALLQLEELLAALAATPVADTGLVQSARLTHATALEATGRLDEAIIALEDFRAEVGDRSADSVRAAVALSRCYRESGDLGRAVETGERELEALQGLGLEGSDEAVQLTVTVAAAHFLRGDAAHAARLCRRAIERAEELGTPVAKASAYWNASIVESERGAVAAAVPLAAKALRLLEDAEDNRNLARLRSELGILLLRLDPPEVEEARTNLEAAEAMLSWSSASQVDLCRNRLHLARAELLSGDVEGAREAGRAVLVDLPRGVARLDVEVRLFLGEAAAVAGDDADAARQHAAAAEALEAQAQDRSAAELWFRLAASLDEAGSVHEALDAYRRAAACSGIAPSRARTDA
ncbi:helix-turn-helix domain-containing protein [Nocardioides anomalus]|uniref:Helix-turn-helix domain-containing protein n=1 Tax=Nocardioides anomalus TaxID=2712223 RepID=A0A6G6WIZ4_9ACTN|nr:helix-turn-helix transcriptional regulator [Nocardioides anomalus]QIG45030.1 helix-turn-helix domain-containing protein [Nocardioides anomalus]